tara:strand:+ start:445 stop:1548 length:1104 start_codon:yes stop_codon:yes gene_type:complete
LSKQTEQIGIKKSEIDTPVLLVDFDALEYNVGKMADHFLATQKSLRPHSKSHKTPEIAKMQLAAGAIGITCAKLGEAEVMADAGIQNILIANEVVGSKKISRLMELAKKCNIIVAVDDPENLAIIDTAAEASGVKPSVLIEVNIGHNRCGVTPGNQAKSLAKQAEAANNISFKGIMGYEGHVVDLENITEREEGARICLQRLVDVRADIESLGINVEICSSSATGDYYISTQYDGITEVQAGSYALMDAAYGRLDLGFKHALTLLTMVCSRPTGEQIITDGGLKSVTPEHGFPIIKNRPDLICHALSEEHGRLKSKNGPCTDLSIGDLIEFIPGHGCTTVNLHDYLYVLREDRLINIWQIAARGRVR